MSPEPKSIPTEEVPSSSCSSQPHIVVDHRPGHNLRVLCGQCLNSIARAHGAHRGARRGGLGQNGSGRYLPLHLPCIMDSRVRVWHTDNNNKKTLAAQRQPGNKITITSPAGAGATTSSSSAAQARGNINTLDISFRASGPILFVALLVCLCGLLDSASVKHCVKSCSSVMV